MDMQYEKINFKDHIVDSNGNVVQQGTPLSAGNLNKLESLAKDASTFLAGELAAQAAHSGVLRWTTANAAGMTFRQDGYGFSTTYLNELLVAAFPVLINGVVLPVKGSVSVSTAAAEWSTATRVPLPPPPTSGERDDFVFLEAWRDKQSQDWKTRIRAVADVDFTTSSNLSTDGFTYPLPSAKGTIPQAQGGNDEPLSYAKGSLFTDPVHMWGAFYNLESRKSTLQTGKKLALDDAGIYIAGDGSISSKELLKTYDGYSYAIPLYKVRRRNSGGYSAVNPNGSRDYVVVRAATTVSVVSGFLANVTLQPGHAANVKPGDRLYYQGNINSGSAYFDVISVNGDVITGIPGFSGNWNNTSDFFCPSPIRLDGLYTNVIDERDITDLRHKTYLVAPSYNQMLVDGLDQHLRGSAQPERWKIMRRNYVGVRKTPLDSNHVFYASFDGRTTPEVGGDPGISGGTFTSGITGAAYRKPATGGNDVPISIGSEGTVEAWVDFDGLTGSADYIFGMGSPNGNQFVGYARQQASGLIFTILDTSGNELSNSQYSVVTTRPRGVHHIRVTFKQGQPLKMYIDGRLVASSPGNYNNEVSITHLRVGDRIGGGRNTAVTLSDFAVSKFDRGDVFASLPFDFIAGYADITRSLHYQRRINADPLTSQKSFAVAKVKNQTQEPGITVTKGAGTNQAVWEAGDKIKLRGLAGEFIGGVIDNDTALARIISTVNAVNVISLDDVSKIAVNDSIIIVGSAGGVIYGSRTVTAVDTANKTITVDGSAVNTIAGQLVLETTANTSSPLVRSIISGSSITVTGTWTGLGTNEAEFTLGTLPAGLDIEDIVIEYSLNIPAGQGGLYHVYSNILGGEANGKRLVKGVLAVTDDLVGKVAGSMVANPIKAFAAINGLASTPSSPGVEFVQSDYDAIKTMDNALKTVSTSVNGQSATIVYSVDIVREFEDRFGKIPGYTLAERIAWLKANINRVLTSIWCAGLSPTGSKATVSVWVPLSNSWFVNSAGAIHTNSVTTKIIGVGHPTSVIDDNGYVHFCAFADASDGVTASTLRIDYLSIEFDIVSKPGYDMLVPENPRRDAGQAAILYVRRQTREVESLFPGNDEDNGIVVIGEYTPTQEIAVNPAISSARDVLYNMQGFVCVAGTNKMADPSNAYSNAIYRMLGPDDDLNYKVDPQSLVSTVSYESPGTSGVLRYWYADIPNGAGINQGLYSDGLPTWARNNAEFFSAVSSLVEYNGELLLKVASRKRSQLSGTGFGGNYTIRYYRLPGRPLYKA